MPGVESQRDDGDERKLEPPKLPPGDPKLALGLPIPPPPPGGLACDSPTTKTAISEIVKSAAIRGTVNSHTPLVHPGQSRFRIGCGMAVT